MPRPGRSSIPTRRQRRCTGIPGRRCPAWTFSISRGSLKKTREVVDRRIPRVPLRYHRRADGTVFPADITIAYFTLDGRSVMILSIRDLTGVQQADDALRIANLKLNLIIGVTRHDVLNSLTALLGYNVILKGTEARPGNGRTPRQAGKTAACHQKPYRVYPRLRRSRGQGAGLAEY